MADFRVMPSQKSLDKRQAEWAKGNHFPTGAVVELISKGPIPHLRYVGKDHTYFPDPDNDIIWQSTCLVPGDITDDRYRLWNGHNPFEEKNLP